MKVGAGKDGEAQLKAFRSAVTKATVAAVFVIIGGVLVVGALGGEGESFLGWVGAVLLVAAVILGLHATRDVKALKAQVDARPEVGARFQQAAKKQAKKYYALNRAVGVAGAAWIAVRLGIWAKTGTLSLSESGYALVGFGVPLAAGLLTFGVLKVKAPNS